MLTCVHGIVAVAVRHAADSKEIGSDADAWLSKLEKSTTVKDWQREEGLMTSAVLTVGQSMWIPFGSFPFTLCLPANRPTLTSTDEDAHNRLLSSSTLTSIFLFM